MKTQVRLKIEESRRTLAERQVEREEKRYVKNRGRTEGLVLREKKNNVVSINRQEEKIVENLTKILQEEKEKTVKPLEKVEIFKLLGI